MDEPGERGQGIFPARPPGLAETSRLPLERADIEAERPELFQTTARRQPRSHRRAGVMLSQGKTCDPNGT
jgi:hypothetical protein